MSIEDHKILEMHELLNGLVENNLSIKEKARLQTLLEESEWAREQYVRFMDMSASMGHYAEELIGDDFEKFGQPNLKDSIVRFVSPILSIAATIAVAFYLFTKFPEDGGPFQQPPQSQLQKLSIESELLSNDGTLAVLTKAVGIKWSNQTGYRPSLGSTLDSSHLQIDEGLAQVEFLQGSTVILEGPVNFELLDDNEGALVLGKLRATVPKVARGFTVHLPKGKLVDLGTEFGLNVYEGGSTEIFVYRGKILYHGENESKEEVIREVSGGEALFVDPYGYANWVEMPSEAFIGTADLAFRSKEDSQSRYASWVQLSDEISQGANAALYYSFDNHSSWDRVLKNRTTPGAAALDGAIIGCKWTEGRWPGKAALAFKRKNDRVRLDLVERLSAFTLSAWLKLDGVQDKISPIFCSENFLSGSASWYINPKGQLVLEVIANGRKTLYQSATAFRSERIGKWAHIATVYDLEKKKVSHFINGRPFSHEKTKLDATISFANASLGYLSRKKPNGRTSLQGSLDEFAIFKVSLPESEIRRLYEIGCPYDLPNFVGPSFP